MHVTEFHVVAVDDEPDVHEISRLAMRQFRVYGLPIRLHSALSKAEGIEVLNGLALARDISLASVALIDVVMETDHAGLELCEHIREVMGNYKLQLYLRTGQPGMAPQRSVLDRYDIQGYVAKSEVTADKLYTLIKAGVRQSYFMGLCHALQDQLRFMAPAAATRGGLTEALRRWEELARQKLAGGMAETIRAPLCYVADNRLVAGLETWAEESVALQRREELRALPAQNLNQDGDRFTLDGCDMLIQIAPTATNAEIHYMLRGTAPAPDWEVFLYHRYLRSFSALWKQAG